MVEVTAGYYGLIQYRPSHARLECVNIGVLLFADGLWYRITDSMSRVRLLGPVHASYDGSLEWLRATLSRGMFVRDYPVFAATRGGIIHFTELRPIKVCVAPEDCVDKLFRELVHDEYD